MVSIGDLQITLSQAQRVPFDLLFGGLAAFAGQQSTGQRVSEALSGFWTNSFSPCQTNLLDINPLKDFLARQIATPAD